MTTWNETIESATPVLENIGYTRGMSRPDLPLGTIIEAPLLIKKGACIGTVDQFDWVKKVPIFYKVTGENIIQNEVTQHLLNRKADMQYKMMIYHNLGTAKSPMWNVYGLVKDYYHGYVASYPKLTDALEHAHTYMLPVMKGFSNDDDIVYVLAALS